ncbi:flagellar biosynthesis protein FlgA [Agrococcus sp. HG114]|uniref:flagellar biosynthesis protein FlgA n=1 Tax=Agrococcus sp. HG114 TaxID=2969757 RepID=UPI00215AA56E|nr:flagellar biosynthesis protein FlgA [Agrococcus sp. HG114]MCR8671920.1 flagellar biosynthesis protein FlgA [Agrococcus sp. HG114]
MAARRTWMDPRLVIGVALVLASVAGVWLVVQQSASTERAWAATRTLLPGETIAAGDLQPVEVRMPQSSERYLTAQADPVGMVVAGTVGEGEVLPLRALGDEAGHDRAAVVIELEGALPTAVRAGALVDVWTAAPGDEGFQAPAVLVDEAIVVGLVEDEGILASAGAQLELLVPADETARLLEAIANDHAVSVVPLARPVAAAP